MEKNYFLLRIANEKFILPFHSVIRVTEQKVKTNKGEELKCLIYQYDIVEPLHFEGSIDDLLKTVRIL